eukprot:SAG31_NODE_1526_length_8004_cov_4.741176_1_plen_313_part_00
MYTSTKFSSPNFSLILPRMGRRSSNRIAPSRIARRVAVSVDHRGGAAGDQAARPRCSTGGGSWNTPGAAVGRPAYQFVVRVHPHTPGQQRVAAAPRTCAGMSAPADGADIAGGIESSTKPSSPATSNPVAMSFEVEAGDRDSGRLPSGLAEDWMDSFTLKQSEVIGLIINETQQLKNRTEPPAEDGIAKSLKSVAGWLATASPNWHQATIFFATTRAEEDREFAKRAPQLFAIGSLVVFLQIQTLCAVLTGTLARSCVKADHCQAGKYCRHGGEVEHAEAYVRAHGPEEYVGKLRGHFTGAGGLKGDGLAGR